MMFGLSIRSLLLGLFTLMIAVVVGLGAFALGRIAAVNDRTVEVATHWLPAVATIRDLEYQSGRYRIGEARHLMSSVAAEMDGIERDQAQRAEIIAHQRRTFESFITSPEERKAYASYSQHWAHYTDIHAELMKLSRAGRNEDAGVLYKGDAQKTFKQINDDLEKLVDSVSSGAKRATDSAAEHYQATRLATFGFGGAGAAVAVGAMVFVLLGIARPLVTLVASMKRLGDGDFSVVLSGLGRHDEIGAMATAVEQFKVKAQEKARREAEEKSEHDRVAAAQRKDDMHKLADAFEKAVGEIVETVSSASTELEASANTLTKAAAAGQDLSVALVSASEEASTNVQSVASATEEMAGSIGEIGRQVQESSRISGEAVSQAQRTDDRITKLAQAASRIGDVTQLITSIAEQTNLLALNATIEAARAGESGRGFAVVAQEVKALASQTAKATGEISGQIAEMQAATHDSVSAIKEIGGTIGRISEIASTIASAVDQQGAATQEIARNIQQAAAGTTQVAANVTDVSRGATETGSASAQVLSAAQSLADQSNRLKLELGKFLTTVRAA